MAHAAAVSREVSREATKIGTLGELRTGEIEGNIAWFGSGSVRPNP